MMNATYLNHRTDALNQHMRTLPVDSRINLILSNGHLVAEMPERLDYLVTLSALRECKSFQGNVNSIEIRMHNTLYIDSSGLSYLLLLSDLLPSRSIRPNMFGVKHPGVKVCLEMANFHRLFDIQFC